jgi:hypothetical protein
MDYIKELDFDELTPYLCREAGRTILSHALHASCLQGEAYEVSLLFEFIKENFIIVHVAPANLKKLIMGSKFEVIRALVANSVQVIYLNDHGLKSNNAFKTELWETQLYPCTTKQIKPSDFIFALLESLKSKELT